MSMLERLGWVLVAARLIFAAHTGAVLLAPVGLALWFAALLSLDEEGWPASVLQVVLVSITCMGAVGAQSWSVQAYSDAMYGAHVLGLSAIGLAMALVCLPFRRARSVWWRVAGFALSWTLASGCLGAVEGGHAVLLGQAWSEVPVLAQWAAIAGPWGLDAWVGAIAACLAEAAVVVRQGLDGEDAPRRRLVGVAMALWAGGAAVGGARLAWAPERVFLSAEAAPEGAQEVLVLQGGVPGWVQRGAMHDPRALALSDAAYAQRIAEAQSVSGPGAWWVLPESAVVDILPAGEAAFVALETQLPPSPLDPVWLTAVSSWAGPPSDRTPWRYSFHALERRDAALVPIASSGKGVRTPVADARYLFDRPMQVIDVRGRAVGPMICWDAMFSAVGLRLASAGAEILVAASNDAGFAQDDGPAWHARSARLRSVETGRSLVYASQAGPSYVADPYGRVRAQLGVNEVGLLRVWIDPTPAVAPYLFVGRGWLLVAGVLWLGLALRLRREGDQD